VAHVRQSISTNVDFYCLFISLDLQTAPLQDGTSLMIMKCPSVRWIMMRYLIGCHGVYIATNVQ